MHNRLHQGPAHHNLYMRCSLSHAIRSAHRRMYLNWSQAGRKCEKSKHGWQAGPVYSVIQPPTTAPLCSAASMATPSMQTHAHLMLFLPSSLPLCEERANIEAAREVFHPRYLHAPLINQHHNARLWPTAMLPSLLQRAAAPTQSRSRCHPLSQLWSGSSKVQRISI